jgi:hypothetical protein
MRENKALAYSLLLGTILSVSFTYSFASGGLKFEVYETNTRTWHIDLGNIGVGSLKTFNVTVECMEETGKSFAAYYLEITGPASLCNDYLRLRWQDTDGAVFTIGKDGDQSFSGIGTLTWNSNIPTVFEAEHKNNISLTLTFLTTAAIGSYNAKMWVAFTEKVEAHVEIMPKVLNLKSRGVPVLAIIRLPETYDPHSVDIKSVKLWFKNSYVQAQSGVPTRYFLIVMFPREEVTQMLSSQRGYVKLDVTGLANVIEFYGTDTIIVIKG